MSAWKWKSLSAWRSPNSIHCGCVLRRSANGRAAGEPCVAVGTGVPCGAVERGSRGHAVPHPPACVVAKPPTATRGGLRGTSSQPSGCCFSGRAMSTRARHAAAACLAWPAADRFGEGSGNARVRRGLVPVRRTSRCRRRSSPQVGHRGRSCRGRPPRVARAPLHAFPRRARQTSTGAPVLPGFSSRLRQRPRWYDRAPSRAVPACP